MIEQQRRFSCIKNTEQNHGDFNLKHAQLCGTYLVDIIFQLRQYPEWFFHFKCSKHGKFNPR